MRRFAIILVLTATLATSACGDSPPTSAGSMPAPALDRADHGLTAVEQRFAAARTIVDMVPLSPDRAAKVRTAEAIAATALAAARAALTVADRVAELRRADAAADRIDAATGIPTAPPTPVDD